MLFNGPTQSYYLVRMHDGHPIKVMDSGNDPNFLETKAVDLIEDGDQNDYAVMRVHSIIKAMVTITPQKIVPEVPGEPLPYEPWAESNE